jgi:hypothetical protein
METTVFDTYLVLHNKEGVRNIDEVLDKLDEMLDTYGIEHSFTLPHGACLEKHPTAVMALNYKGEDNMALSLVYALFSKIYRGADDYRLGKVLAQIASDYTREAEKPNAAEENKALEIAA